MSLSDSQIVVIEVTARTCSILSLVGTAFIVTTFLCVKSFHKPINRLVFYAAWGNIMSNIATLISVSGIRLGVGGPLCQFQAFLLQWFLPADALWTLAMACNVYLTFFRNYNAQQLRSLEWKYLILCYGLPFIPAFVYFFVKTAERGRVYGSAVVWCWVSINWDFLRIAVVHGPVWLVILSTFAIYVLVGRVIFKRRQQLLDFAGRLSDVDNTPQSPPLSAGITRTTEIYFTREPAELPETQHQIRSPADFESHAAPGQSPTHYSVAHEPARPTCDWPKGSPEFTTSAAHQSPIKSEHSPKPTKPTSARMQQRSLTIDANRAAVSYCKCAVLFFIALLVTWVPSTINRVYTLVHPETISFPMLYANTLVLPLQGFWNAVIYILTSLPACRALYQRVAVHGAVLMNPLPTRRRSVFSSANESIGLRRSKKQEESRSESLEELRGVAI